MPLITWQFLIVILGDVSIFPNVEYQWISWIITGSWKPADSEEKKRQPSPNWELLDFCAHRSPPGWVKWIERKILSANDNNSLTRKVWLYWVIPNNSHVRIIIPVRSQWRRYIVYPWLPRIFCLQMGLSENRVYHPSDVIFMGCFSSWSIGIGGTSSWYPIFRQTQIWKNNPSAD